jgi:hypothetical protein
MYCQPSNRIFCSNGSISDVFEKRYKDIESTISYETENDILNYSETEYIEYLEDKYKLNAPEIHFDEACVESHEDDIPAEYFAEYRNPRAHRLDNYRKEVIQYNIPCTGNVNLLSYCPASKITSSGCNFDVKGDSITVQLINFSNDPTEIKRQYETEVRNIHSNYDTLVKDIEVFNLTLKGRIQIEFRKVKQKYLDKNNLLASLGVPLKKKDNVPTTFSIPKPKLREKIVIKPVVYEKSFKPEPSLDDNNYEKILRLINDVGKNFERMPSIYKGKGEEDLRDFILMTLDPNFESGSATGETFNKEGKTDIMLCHNSSVAFIAECKFWSGEKNYLSTINQLLSYLTWRNTKASIIVFVTEKNFTDILEKVKNGTNKHSNYLGFVNKTDENWFNYRFHINGDKNREVKLAVQLFHLPN